MPTYPGTPGDDTTTGSESDDIINGEGGNDTLDGAGGNDVINGGDGNDILTGGTGSDTIYGGDGDDIANYDTFTGSTGVDYTDLGAGSDVVNVSGHAQVRLTFTSAEVGNGLATDGVTGTNQDGGLAVRLRAELNSGNLSSAVSRFDDEGITFVAAQGTTFDVRDLVSGAARGDYFEVVALGTSGDDVQTAIQGLRPYYFNGGAGNDTITGGSASDFLVGGAGDDILNGGGGSTSDTFLGGGGNDTLNHSLNTAGADFADLGAGSDVVNVSGAAQVRLTFTSAEVGNGLATDAGNLTNQDGGFAVRLQRENPAGGTVTTTSRFDDEGITFVAAAGSTFDVRDLVSGAQRGDQFGVVGLGTSGADTFTATAMARAHYYNGGAGNDVVTGGDVNDFLVGGAGDDSLSGGAGADSFIGGAGADSILGGGGVDTVIHDILTAGADTVDLGSGQDIVNVTGASQIRLTFTSAEVGNDAAADSNSMLNQDGGLAVRMQAEDVAGLTTGAASRIDDEGVTFVAGAGSTFDVRDLVSGAARGDYFNVVTLGGSGNDVQTAVLESSAYYFNGGGGADTITGGLASDFIVGGAGDDILTGGGGSTVDTFLGGGGNDTLNHNVDSAGGDFADLGAGADVVNVSGAKQIRLTFTSAEVGNGSAADSAILPNQDGGLGVRLQRENASGGTVVTTSRFDDEGITFVAAAGTTFDVRDLVSGTQRGDQFSVVSLGTSGGDTMTVSAGGRAHYFNGGAGNDLITGGASADFLVGGSGDDIMTGGLGADTFIGGLGADVFAYGELAESTTGTTDTILSFEIGIDKIDLRAVASSATIEIIEGSSYVRYGPDNAGLIIATGVILTQNDILVGGQDQAPSLTAKEGPLVLPAEFEDLATPAQPDAGDVGSGALSDSFDFGEPARGHSAMHHDWMLV